MGLGCILVHSPHSFLWLGGIKLIENVRKEDMSFVGAGKQIEKLHLAHGKKMLNFLASYL